ncbi:MAG: translation initiation factor IF-2 [Planctomycetota bacterium]
MAKRVFEIAKELGVASKAIVSKCQAEGIPEATIKNHMSSVSVGLEATIREWFAEGGESEHAGGTAVETSKRVDLKRARAAAKPRAKAKAVAGKAAQATSTAGGDIGTAVEDDVAAANGAAVAANPAGTLGEPGQAASTALTEAPPAGTPAANASGTSAAAATNPTTTGTAPGVAHGGRDGPTPADQTVAAASGRTETPPADAVPVSSPKMNVPDRPKVISPAGPRIEDIQKKQVRLSGPRVVRVEAPEQVEAPRRRRPPSDGGPGGATEMAPGGGGGGGAGRRDNRRRSGGPDRGGSGSPFRQQDLIERQARLQRAGGYMKKRRAEIRRRGDTSEKAQTPAQKGGTVKIGSPFTIKELSAATGVKAADIVKALFMQGVMTTPNAVIDPEKAQEIMMDYDIELEVGDVQTAEEKVEQQFEDREMVDERPRGAIVTILGHVDHGKTSLLDRIRNANVAAGEAGGITQATSAFRVPVKAGEDAREKMVTFIDTPGHEAFTAMRARGATVTDIAVLVVAADDGVMPQTAESISHAKAAGVQIVVALNKIDKPEATDGNIQRILGQLAERDLNPVEWGGDTEVIKTSAHTGEGIQDLLDILDLQAEVLEMKADFGGPARGTIIESRMEDGRGVVANLLLQDGQLKIGQFLVAGRSFGRVRDITDDRGKKLKEALPPMPVQISGLDGLPDAGDKFYIVDTLKKAEQAASQRREREREQRLAQPKATLDTMFSSLADQEVKEILIVLKADVQGSVDVLRNEIEKIKSDEVRVRVLHSAVGGIAESDVILAEASSAIIVGFNVIASAKARSLADQKGIEIRNYDVIYHITEDITKAAEGLLRPELRQEVLGHAEVREVFRISKVGMIAGCYVTDGTVERDALIRVTRQDIVIENDRKLEQLKRFKDDAKDVRSGMECGMKIVGYDDIKSGDILECYRQIEVARTLEQSREQGRQGRAERSQQTEAAPA